MTKETAIESPPVNIYESSDQLTVAIPMPGAHDDTVSVQLAGLRLTVEAEPRYAQDQQNYLQHEWTLGNFHRGIDLPKPVRGSGARAVLTHGVLTISLPLGGEDSSERIRIPVSEPQVHQGQSH